jgi:hypothetical protein
VFGLAVLALTPPAAPALGAGGEQPAAKETALPPDLRLVPADAAGFVSVRPADLLGTAPVKKVLAAFGKDGPVELREVEKAIGSPLAEVERLTALVADLDGRPVVIVRTAKPYDRDKLLKAVAPDARAETHGGKTVHVSKKMQFAVCFADKRVYVLGSPEKVGGLLERAAKDGGGPLAEARVVAAGQHHVVAALRPGEVLRSMAPRRYEYRGAKKGHGPPPIPSKEAPSKDDRDDRDKERRDERKDHRKKEKPKDDRRDDILCSTQAAERPEPPPDKAPPWRGPTRAPAPSVDEILEKLPAEALPFKPLLLARSVTATLGVGATTKASLRLVSADEEKARDGVTAVKAALYVARELLPRAVQEMGVSPAGERKVRAILQAVETGLRSAAVERHDSRVRANVQVKVDPAAVASAAEVVRETSLRARSANNLRQIAVAMHNFAAAHGADAPLPANAIYGPGKKPLLSWRVAILPYLGEGALYREFKLDEPWDSPHNKKLLARMPRVYAARVGKAKAANTTFYQVFVGNYTPFYLERVRTVKTRAGAVSLAGASLANFPDGTFNTILVVEAGEAVPWTKPQDLPYDQKKPLPKLGGLFPEGFHAVFADGSVRMLRKDFDEKTLRDLLQFATGHDKDQNKVLLRPERRR